MRRSHSRGPSWSGKKPLSLKSRLEFDPARLQSPEHVDEHVLDECSLSIAFAFGSITTGTSLGLPLPSTTIRPWLSNSGIWIAPPCATR
jgi:hypothetical protein